MWVSRNFYIIVNYSKFLNYDLGILYYRLHLHFYYIASCVPQPCHIGAKSVHSRSFRQYFLISGRYVTVPGCRQASLPNRYCISVPLYDIVVSSDILISCIRQPSGTVLFDYLFYISARHFFTADSPERVPCEAPFICCE